MPLSQFTSRMVNDQGLFQLFLMDPNDVKIELNFANSEINGVRVELTKWGQSRWISNEQDAHGQDLLTGPQRSFRATLPSARRDITASCAST